VVIPEGDIAQQLKLPMLAGEGPARERFGAA